MTVALTKTISYIKRLVEENQKHPSSAREFFDRLREVKGCAATDAHKRVRTINVWTRFCPMKCLRQLFMNFKIVIDGAEENVILVDVFETCSLKQVYHGRYFRPRRKGKHLQL